MYTDVCEVTPVLYSRENGTRSVGTAYETKARIEAKPKSTGGTLGLTTEYIGLYILPPDVLVMEGYLIRPIKINGVAIDATAVKVEEVFKLGRGKPHHIEVRT